MKRRNLFSCIHHKSAIIKTEICYIADQKSISIKTKKGLAKKQHSNIFLVQTCNCTHRKKAIKMYNYGHKS